LRGEIIGVKREREGGKEGGERKRGKESKDLNRYLDMNHSNPY
jgi:hypothetical protein